MPRPGPRRPYVAMRLGAAELADVDALAAERGENRSETLRAMLAYAAERMPRGWAVAVMADPTVRGAGPGSSPDTATPV